MKRASIASVAASNTATARAAKPRDVFVAEAVAEYCFEVFHVPQDMAMDVATDLVDIGHFAYARAEAMRKADFYNRRVVTLKENLQRLIPDTSHAK